MIKKVFKVLFFLFFVLFAIFLICFGFYIQNISSPKYIYKSGMSKVMNTFVDYLSYDNDYVFGDNFNIDGNLALNISNDVYKNKALYDSEYLKKNNLINNLSNMEINYRISQNRKSKQLFLSLNEQMENNIIFNGNYLVDDSTKYYLVNSIDKNYINATIDKNQNIEKNENDLKKKNIKENTKKEDDFPETRDEQLELIRKKYMDNEENDNDNNNNENNDIENMENIDNTERELNKEDLNEENKQFEEKENKPEQQLPFKV